MWKKCKPIKRQTIIRLAGLAAVFFLLAQSGVLLALELGAVRIYRKVGSPIAARTVTCQYEVSCSTYALGALQEHGFWKGNRLVAGRLVMCSPIGWAYNRMTGPENHPERKQNPLAH